MGQRGELFSSYFRSEEKTYFFNVKENRQGDVFLNIVESKKREVISNSGAVNFHRSSIIIYEESITEFIRGFDGIINFFRDDQFNKTYHSNIVTERRTYEFSIRKDKAGIQFLKIQENSRKLQKSDMIGVWQRHSVLIPKDDFLSFLEVFDEALSFIQDR